MISVLPRRGEQLMLLRNLQFTRGSVSGCVLKTVLRAIDDHGTSCWASIDRLAYETCLCEKAVRKAIQQLIELGFVSAQNRNQGKIGQLSINWNTVQTSVPDTEVSLGSTSVPHSQTSVRGSLTSVPHSQTSVPRTDKTKETILNEKKRDLLSKLRFDEGDLELSKWMFSKIKTVAPKAKKPNFEKWANAVRLMRESDGHSLDEIRSVFEWANSDQFWRSNILSVDKLRKQFGTLDAKRRGQGTKRRFHSADRKSLVDNPDAGNM